MFTFVCLFLLPLVIMIFCYMRILVEISSRMARNNRESVFFLVYSRPDLFMKAKLSFVTRLLVFFPPVLSRDVHLRRSHNNIPKARMRTLKMSIVIVMSFIVCWTPYYLLGLWYWLFPEKMEETVSHSLTHMLFIFGLFNACLDPITYGLFTIHLHQGLKRCCRTAQTNPENNTCLVHTTRFSSHQHNASGAYNTDKEEVINDTRTKKKRPIIPVSKM